VRMSQHVWIRSISLALLLALGLYGTIAAAQSYDPDQDIPKPTVLEKRMNKLGRGFTNVLFGWTEIPVTWHQKMRQGRPLTYLVGTAPVLGATRAVMRTGVGVYEVFTFYSSKDGVNYEAILEPEYIF
jgi:putative exosortase-associated protein (TIGR04073 family)